MPTYNKLVRDKIPVIIEQGNKRYETRTLSHEEFQEELKIKLKEELEEFLSTDSSVSAVEELADMLEVIKSLAEINNVSFAQLEEVRLKKEKARGGFNDRIFLITVED